MLPQETIAYWRDLKHSLSPEEFLSGHGEHPFLLRRRLATTAPQARADSDWGGSLQYNTDVVAVDDVPTRGPGRLSGAKVIVIVKSDRNPFAGQISVGRAKNCDIILRDASVSKNHAFFRVIDGDSAELVDTRSQNLTRLNGAPLAPLAPARIESGDMVIFGTVAATFLSAAGLYQLL